MRSVLGASVQRAIKTADEVKAADRQFKMTLSKVELIRVTITLGNAGWTGGADERYSVKNVPSLTSITATNCPQCIIMLFIYGT